MKYKLGDITIKNWNSWDRVPRVDVIVAAMFPSLTAGTFAYAVAYACGHIMGDQCSFT